MIKTDELHTSELGLFLVGILIALRFEPITAEHWHWWKYWASPRDNSKDIYRMFFGCADIFGWQDGLYVEQKLRNDAMKLAAIRQHLSVVKN